MKVRIRTTHNESFPQINSKRGSAGKAFVKIGREDKELAIWRLEAVRWAALKPRWAEDWAAKVRELKSRRGNIGAAEDKVVEAAETSAEWLICFSVKEVKK